MAGFRGYYVPESVAFHKGWGTFEPQLGQDQCDELASRNTLIFMWKNTGGARLLAVISAGFRSVLRALCSWGGPVSCGGFVGALKRLDEVLAARRALAVGQGGWIERQEAFFRRFSGERADVCELRSAQGRVISSTQGGD